MTDTATANNGKRKALLAGATGVVGRQLMSLLLTDDSYDEVHVLTRRTMAAVEPKLHVHEVDFDRLDAHAGLFDVDDVFCCLGSTMKKAGSKEAFYRVDHGYVVRLAQLASEAGAQQFLMISAVGANPRAMVFYSRVKGEAERDVRQVGPDTIHILRPSLLLGDRSERRVGEEISKQMMPLLNPLLGGPMKKYRGVHPQDVARQMLELAKSGPAGQHVHYCR